jgi:hypothetical protein
MFRLWAIRWTATQHVGANISMQSPQDAFADLQRQLRDTSDPSRSASDNLRAACAAYLDFARSRSQRYRVMFGAVWNAEEALQRFPERSQDLTRLGLGAFGARRLRHRLRRPTGINERGLVRRRHRPLGRPARARGASRRHTSVPLAARPRGHPDHPSRASPIQVGTGPALMRWPIESRWCHSRRRRRPCSIRSAVTHALIDGNKRLGLVGHGGLPQDQRTHPART